MRESVAHLSSAFDINERRACGTVGYLRVTMPTTVSCGMSYGHRAG
jgi:hypothetical protein